jgi:catechol 2,3-dioxygenase-like lactoylglutathione lyase family enzyme
VVPQILGFHHVTMPTADALRSSDWYARVFGFSTVLVIEEESCVVAVLLEHPSGVRLYLRQAPDRVGAWRGLGLLGLAVPDRDSLVEWDKYLTELSVDHGGIHWAHLGWALTVVDSDGMRIQLHTREAVSSEDL